MSQPVLYGAVIFAKDYRALARFYRQVAELTETEVHKDYILLEAAGFQLVMHPIPERIAAGITIETPPRPRSNAAIKLFLSVGSMEAARQKAKELGGELYGADKEWNFQGSKRCDGVDPEGNEFQLRESLSEAAE